MKTRDIINFARDLKRKMGNDPYVIAAHYGVEVMQVASPIKDFTAQIIKMTDCPTIITINKKFSEFSKKVLCAHELGHALLHSNCVNYFATTPGNVKTTLELEANLFAIVLLGDDDIEDQLCLPLENMNNYILKTIMDYNIY